jgi:hypothetical protein
MELQMYHYATVSIALKELTEKGYTIDYNLKQDQIINSPYDFTIEEIYRYEGETDPSDESTVYGIKCSTGEKGAFVNGLSSDSDNNATTILNGLFIKGRQEYNASK